MGQGARAGRRSRSVGGVTVAVALVGALLLAACGSDGGSKAEGASSTTTAPTTPVDVASPATDPSVDVLTPIIASVLAPPVPVRGTDGLVHLAYELLVTNMVGQPATFTSIRAVAGDATLQALTGDEIGAWFRATTSPMGATVLAPGQQGIVWIDATVATEADVPATIEHVIEVTFPEVVAPFPSTTITETIAPVAVLDEQPVRISAPLAGPRWVDGNGCCVVGAHRGAVNPINGWLWVAERYAIDYVQINESGRLFDGDKTKLESYAYYGAEILAVADGPIVSMKTDLVEQVPGTAPTGLQVNEYGGNNVIQDIGNGHYAFYAHLQADNPLGLQVGQMLRRGETVGLLGNTGNSDAPHLHFHIMDAPNALVSNGLPFVIDSFELEGQVSAASITAALEDGGVFELDTTQAGRRTDEFPLFRDVMTYTRPS